MGWDINSMAVKKKKLKENFAEYRHGVFPQLLLPVTKGTCLIRRQGTLSIL